VIRGAGLAALLLGALAASPAGASDETPEDLPAGPGRDETFYACVACHGLAIIKAQGMTRGQWEDALGWMVTRHGMAEIDPADRTLILDYLAATYPPRSRGRPNPFAGR